MSSQVKSIADSGSGSGAAAGKIANPPARTIRFDGHEIVLGQAEPTELTPDKLHSLLEPLVAAGRLRSASAIIENHRESAERYLAERWAVASVDPSVVLAAQVLSRRTTDASGSWNSLLKLAQENPTTARPYQQLRNTFAQQLQTSDPSNEQAAQLQQLAQSVNHPLVKIDCLRLLGLRELVAGRTAWAEALCRQAVEAARASGNPLLAAELSLMVAEAARRSDQLSLATQAWSAGVSTHLSALDKSQPIDVSFWLLAEHIRPEGMVWPNELIGALGHHLESLGATSDGGVEMVLWACVAEAQFQRAQMQAALVNFKKAESATQGDNVLWLRIAQSKCLAALGQVPAASAILSGPASSSKPHIAAAATAAMGSTKLQAGAYQQGAQLLHKALSDSSGSTWATKSAAMADLALAQLIIGDTEPGLEALHTVQAQFAQAGDTLMLLRSLENELHLLEHEQRASDVQAVKQRMAELEKL
ncbi:MAG: hypothetical protein IT423_19570 [Pirellulaceae bacterium]|nr:hypothetical protein [Pirellulaceae bacterium]